MMFLYLITGVIFGIGLAIAGMTDPHKVQAFLSLGFSDWNPALMFVLGSAAPVYGIIFAFISKRKKTLSGKTFVAPAKKPADKKLVVGSIIFGLGWGILGICPGPALTQLSSADAGMLTFIVAMFVGFILERKIA